MNKEKTTETSAAISRYHNHFDVLAVVKRLNCQLLFLLTIKSQTVSSKALFKVLF